MAAWLASAEFGGGDAGLDGVRADGTLRATVTVRDLVLVIALMCQPVPDQDNSFNATMVQILLHDLRHKLSLSASASATLMHNVEKRHRS